MQLSDRSRRAVCVDSCVQRFSEAFPEMRTFAFSAGHMRAKAAISLGK